VSYLSNFPHIRGIILELQLVYTSIVYRIVNVICTNFYIYDDILIQLCLVGCFPPFIYLVLLHNIYNIKVIRLPNKYQINYHFLDMLIGLGGAIVIVIIIKRKVALNANVFRTVSSAEAILFLER
jgi:hypothetical protein